jgi:hypothetical protein
MHHYRTSQRFSCSLLGLGPSKPGLPRESNYSGVPSSRNRTANTRPQLLHVKYCTSEAATATRTGTTLAVVRQAGHGWTGRTGRLGELGIARGSSDKNAESFSGESG